MKTILVPTDFSTVSRNAVDYAVEIAKVSNAKLILFHVFHVPVVPAEIPISMPVDEIEKDCMDGLKKIEREIHLKYGNALEMECQCQYGFPIEEINLYAKEKKIDLIVMGTEGTGYLTEKFMGNITTSLIKRSHCPVLAINEEAKFNGIKKIALACDYEEMKDKSILEPLKEMVRIFGSHIYVLNVTPEYETVPTVSNAVEGIKLSHALEGVTHSFHHSKNEDIIEGINDFVDEKKIDLLVMIPRDHSALRNLFREPYTKRMAFHTKVPLLALHE